MLIGINGAKGLVTVFLIKSLGLHLGGKLKRPGAQVPGLFFQLVQSQGANVLFSLVPFHRDSSQVVAA